MNKLEKIVEAGVVKVRVLGAPGKPSHPLMSGNGQFFINAGAAAAAFCCSVPTINNKVKSGHPVKGQLIWFASEQEVDAFISTELSSPSVPVIKPHFAPTKPWEGKLNRSDGSITITRRLSGFGEVPPENVNYINWDTSDGT